MGKTTGIAWTDHTFNPWWGCTKVSPGCDHCYAETWAKRVGMQIWGVDTRRRVFEHKHWAEPLRWNRLAGARGVRERVFCASMADVFENHPALPEERDKLWTLIHKTPHLDWQLLTKRIGNVARMVPPSWMSGHWPAHVQLGISVVNQEELDRDAPKLLGMPAQTRFLSCEPLLGPLEFSRLPFRDGDARHSQNALTGETRLYCTGIDGNPDVHVKTEPVMPRLAWVIVGGESGGKARGFRVQWARDIVRQCKESGVPVFVKQMGAYVIDRNDAGFDGCEPWEWPEGTDDRLEHEIHGYVERHQGADVRVRLADRAGADPAEWPEDLRVREFPA